MKRKIEKLVSILFILMAFISTAHSDVPKIDRDDIEKYILWLVPDDGRVNGVAHINLVNAGDLAGKLIVEHVFNYPKLFFINSDRDDQVWLFGTQSNAASVLAEMGYIKALPVLKEHYTRDTPKYLKNVLRESIEILESVSINGMRR